jgi:dihydrofolate synthase / folylpolyglutamate synthase
LEFELYCDLAGSFQGKNIITAMTGIDILNDSGFKINKDNIIKGISHAKRNTGLRGRWDTISSDLRIICDIAHNEGAINEVMNQLAGENFQKLRMVFGVSEDKNMDRILPLLPHNAFWYFCKPSVPRGMDAEQLKNAASGWNLIGNSYPTVKDALLSAISDCTKDEIVLITGSAFVVADALRELEKNNHPISF